MTPFGLTLKAALKGARLSQSRAAELAGYDHSYVCRLCSGQRMPSRHTVEHLVRRCGFSPDVSRQLYETAGFIPTADLASPAFALAREDATLQEAAHALVDETIPLPYREHLRFCITAQVAIARQMAAS